MPLFTSCSALAFRPLEKKWKVSARSSKVFSKFGVFLFFFFFFYLRWRQRRKSRYMTVSMAQTPTIIITTRRRQKNTPFPLILLLPLFSSSFSSLSVLCSPLSSVSSSSISRRGEWRGSLCVRSCDLHPRIPRRCHIYVCYVCVRFFCEKTKNRRFVFCVCAPLSLSTHFYFLK